MPIEVEQKFRVAALDSLDARLRAAGGVAHEPVTQADLYFAHPGRDFARTDEALRLRRVGEHNYITYKGPKLDATTKTRHENEIALQAGNPTAEQAVELFQALGFGPVAEVVKQRVHFTLRWQDREVEVALDEVEGLGNFVELEIVTTEDKVALARECLGSLARHLGLSESERRSYLELLLEKRATEST